jgi:hypothetical protein
VAPRPLPLIGWREWVAIDGCPDPVKAKIDTGARTSALHGDVLDVAGGVVHFALSPHQRSDADRVALQAPLVDERAVRSSNGEVEQRPVVRLVIRLGTGTHAIDCTITQRDEMGFRMLLGRTAIRRRFAVDPGRSFLLGGTSVAPL